MIAKMTTTNNVCMQDDRKSLLASPSVIFASRVAHAHTIRRTYILVECSEAK